MAADSLFQSNSYKEYLHDQLEGSGSSKRKGKKAGLAAAMNCQFPYLSRVLRGDADLNPDQAFAASQYFGHSSEEANYFLLLLLRDRAATSALKQKMTKELDKIKIARLKLQNRIPLKQQLSLDAQVKYYSAWWYSAVHIGLTIPKLDSPEKLASFLGISLGKVKLALEFLVAHGLAKKEKGRISVTETHIHLPENSTLVSKLHSNWRLKALENIDGHDDSQFHYSSVVSLSKADIHRIREIFIQAVEKTIACIKASPEETLVCYNIDIFGLEKLP